MQAVWGRETFCVTKTEVTVITSLLATEELEEKRVISADALCRAVRVIKEHLCTGRGFEVLKVIIMVYFRSV